MCGRVSGVNIDKKGDPGILGRPWGSAASPSEQRLPVAGQMQATVEVVKAQEGDNCRMTSAYWQDRTEAKPGPWDPRSLRGQRMCKGVAGRRAVFISGFLWLTVSSDTEPGIWCLISRCLAVHLGNIRDLGQHIAIGCLGGSVTSSFRVQDDARI